jgi:phage-related protein
LSGTEGLYEIRIEYSGDIFRVLSFFDEGDMIVLLQGFKKKSQKLPQREIKRAEAFRSQYFEEKKLSLLRKVDNASKIGDKKLGE